MFSRQETAALTKEFWTSFGQYMLPVPSARQEKTSWINYKTGVKDIHFKMEIDAAGAHIGIAITATDPRRRGELFQQLAHWRPVLESKTGEAWNWQAETQNAQQQAISRIGTTLANVHIYNKTDWPAIISFFKPRIIALDAFWVEVRPGFEG